jgi:peptidoglycan hydrolase CwlO-like protein
VVAQQRDNAQHTIQELLKTLKEREKEVEELKLKVNYLTMSSSIAPDNETLDKTAAIITGLVRDIDRCIADLKE